MLTKAKTFGLNRFNSDFSPGQAGTSNIVLNQLKQYDIFDIGAMFSCWFGYSNNASISGASKIAQNNTNKAFVCSDWADIETSLVETMNIRSALNELPFASMKRSKSTQRIQVLGFTAVFFLSITSLSADEQVIYPEACSPQNTYCYFQRYGNIKLPRIEPIQASKIRLVFFFYFLQA